MRRPFRGACSSLIAVSLGVLDDVVTFALFSSLVRLLLSLLVVNSRPLFCPHPSLSLAFFVSSSKSGLYMTNNSAFALLCVSLVAARENRTNHNSGKTGFLTA